MSDEPFILEREWASQFRFMEQIDFCAKRKVSFFGGDGMFCHLTILSDSQILLAEFDSSDVIRGLFRCIAVR